MADVITRFKLETTQYDSKLRDASKGLAEYTRQATQAGNEFGKFTQKNIEAARALGSITPSANNAKDKVKELVGAFNDSAKAYNALTKEQQQSDFGKAMADSLGQLSQQLKDAKKELYDMGDAVKNAGGGGLFSGLGDKMSGALQVFGGNMLTKAAGAVASLGSEMVGMVQQGVELAQQGEGIRIAFERLGRGDILDGLRQATHGTVTDLELMKAAVKFNDFKLPLDELGTMLAFAQQKAKDTGQSVDFLVESIVNGLGRKSLMILDNLGLSANEVKEKMNETGDMTKAVGEIIREQMSKAGDYVETAADRAAKADVDLKNAMEDLGRTFQPLTNASDSLWNSIKIGALNALNTAVKPLIQALAEAGALGAGARSTAGFNRLGGNSKVDRMIGRLGDGKSQGAYNIYKRQLAEFDKYISNKQFQIAAYGNDKSGVAQSAKTKLKAELDGALKMRAEYVKRAQELHDKVPSPYEPTASGAGGSGGGGKGGTTTITEEKDEFTEIIGLVGNAQERVSDLQRQISESWDEGEIARLTGELKVAQRELQRLKDIGKEKPMQQGLSGFNQQTMSAWMQGRQGDLAKAEYGSADYSSIMGNIADMNTIKTILEQSMKAGINAAQFDLSGLWEKVFDGDDIPDATWQDMVNKLNEKLKEMKLEPISIEFKTGEIAKDGKIIKSSYKDAASAVNSLGSALAGLDDPAAKIAGVIAQSIANVALAFSSAQLKDGESGNVWYWIAAVAAGAAAMVSTIATIHSATGYARGGVIKAANGAAIPGTFTVPGTTYSNDQIPAMLNAGETVLTRAQAGNIASQLQGAGGSINLNGVLTGENIFLSADRYARRSGRGELVTFHR